MTDTSYTVDVSTQPHLSDDSLDMSTHMTKSEDMEDKASVIPAVDVDLTGKHLIEASAGTGKTWTLTGIMLRLLIEARRARANHCHYLYTSCRCRNASAYSRPSWWIFINYYNGSTA